MFCSYRMLWADPALRPVFQVLLWLRLFVQAIDTGIFYLAASVSARKPW